MIETMMILNGANYSIEQVGDGPPLLMLHGFTGSGRSWQAHLPVLSRHFQVITIDLLGHGQSAVPDEPDRYSIENAANDLIHLIDGLARQPVHLLGYSMGGRLALYMAVHYPNHIARLVLESASPGLQAKQDREKRRKSDNKLATFIETEGIEKFVDYWENIPLFATQKRLPDSIQQMQRDERLRCKPAGLANSLRGMGTGVQPSLWDRLPTIRTPTQIIAGQLDTKFVEIAHQMHAKLPNSQLAISENAGHTVHLEDPQMFDTCVINFLYG